MNKEEFMGNLKQQLKNLPKSEIEKVTGFYDEMIQDRMEDGMSEDEAIENIGGVRVAAEAALQDVSLPLLMKASVKEIREKSSNKTLWLVLVILGFPVWFPLLLAFFITVFTCYLTLWILIASLYIVEIAFALSCVFGIVASVVFTFTHSIPVGVCLFGFSLALGGLAIAGFEPAGFLAKKLMNGLMLFIKKVKLLFIRKEEMI